MRREEIAYHASFATYRAGTVVRARSRTASGRQEEVEAVLDNARPLDKLSRMKALFVAANAAHAKRYLLAETSPSREPVHVYEVLVPRCAKHPMAVVGWIAQSVNDSRVAEMAAEYWNPTGPWSFVEGVVSEMEIVGVGVDVDIVALANATLDYEGDRKHAKRRWP